jgi:site-specific recombinase XerD
MMADVRRRIMDTTLSTYISEFVATKQTEGLSAKTISWYRWLLEKFSEAAGNPCLADLTIASAREFIAGLQSRNSRYENHPKAHPQPGGLSVYTISAYVRTLKVFSRWLLEEGYTKADLFARLKIPRTPDTIIDVLTDDEINRILDSINPASVIGARLYAIVLLLLDTGIRASELCDLTLAHTDLTDNVVKVMGKGKKERLVYFSPATKKAIHRYLSIYRPESTCDRLFLSDDGTPLTYNGLRLIFLRLGIKANIPRLHLHLLRHTFAVRYLMNGGDLMSLKRLLGHTEISTTSLYLHLTETNVQAQAVKFSPVDRLGLGSTKRNHRGGNGK